jgi:hypothetical protein
VPGFARLAWLTGASLVGAYTLGQGRAHAQNEHPYPVGEVAAGMGGAAVAVVRDGSAPWHNPAGLGRIGKEGISASASVYGFRYDRAKDVFFGADRQGSALLLFPSAIGYTKPLPSRWGHFRHALGAAVVVPDYDRLKTSLDEEAGEGGFSTESNDRQRHMQQTVWLLPGWGGCWNGRLCLGIAGALAYWSSDGFWTSYFQAAGVGIPSSRWAMMGNTDLWALSAGAQVGAQLHLSERWWAGLLVRSPVRRVMAGGQILLLESNVSPGSDPRQSPEVTLLRAEESDPQIDLRVPVQVRGGLGYESARWLIALDARLSLPQAQYAALRAADGQTTLQPRDARKNPTGDPMNVGIDHRRQLTANANLGAQFWLTPGLALQAGIFTDRSGISDEDLEDIAQERLERTGVTLGITMRGALTTTHLGVVGTRALGKTSGTNLDIESDEVRTSLVDVSSHAIFVTFGGSTRLGSDDTGRSAPR